MSDNILESDSPSANFSHSHDSPIARMLRLQASVGNYAAQNSFSLLKKDGNNASVIRRYTLTPEEKAENLKSPRFAGDSRLEAAYDNSPPMRRGEQGEAVKKIQQALIELGFHMPISTKKTGSPDGIYGKETKQVVKEFQRKHKVRLGPDGVIGRFTMGKLDALYAGTKPPKPKTGKPEIEATETAVGSYIVDSMEKANKPSSYSPTSGIWYAHNYKAAHDQNPAGYPWNDDHRKGYANPAFFKRIGWMDWRLKPRVSASEGIKAWVKGLTIAECLTAIIAIKIDALRAAIGDAKFDKNFGSTDFAMTPPKRLRIRPGTKGTPIEKLIEETEASKTGNVGVKGNRPVKKGEWYYFYNHPKYLLKHPDGAFQGENAVFMGTNPAGRQIWSGLGVSKVTEDGMMNEMKHAYNSPRSSDDYRRLVLTYAAGVPELSRANPNYKTIYEKYINRIPDKYRHDKGHYKEVITKAEILNDPPYTLDGTRRKGGFVSSSGIKLDIKKIQKMREG